MGRGNPESMLDCWQRRRRRGVETAQSKCAFHPDMETLSETVIFLQRSIVERQQLMRQNPSYTDIKASTVMQRPSRFEKSRSFEKYRVARLKDHIRKEYVRGALGQSCDQRKGRRRTTIVRAFRIGACLFCFVE